MFHLDRAARTSLALPQHPVAGFRNRFDRQGGSCLDGVMRFLEEVDRAIEGRRRSSVCIMPEPSSGDRNWRAIGFLLEWVQNRSPLGNGAWPTSRASTSP